MKQSSHLESSAGTGGTGRAGILPDRDTETPVDRKSRSKNSPMKQSTPMESPAVTGGTGRTGILQDRETETSVGRMSEKE